MARLAVALQERTLLLWATVLACLVGLAAGQTWTYQGCWWVTVAHYLALIAVCRRGRSEKAAEGAASKGKTC